MKTPLISKNRQANELRDQAHKIRHELMDSSVALSAEQVEKMTNDMRALDMRAQTAAEFTPEAEIDRQQAHLADAPRRQPLAHLHQDRVEARPHRLHQE